MSEPSEKITIRPEDLVKPQPAIAFRDPAAPRLLPLDQPVDPAVGLRSEHRLPLVAWVAVTLVPFLNAWIWWRHAPATAHRSLFRAVAFVLAGISTVATVAWLLWLATALAEDDWVEQIARRADRSVVRIESFPSSLGTGFVIASDGDRHLVLTNRHVITTPNRCRVVLRTGYAVPGEVAGYASDDNVDLALLVVTVSGLRALGPIAEFGDVRVGEKVVAIGHPLGLDFTVTDGIVSAKRGGMELQTSAPISPGNSGGPLVNQRGYVLGVNTRIVNPSEAQSLGFAIRADLVLHADKWSYATDVSDLRRRIARK